METFAPDAAIAALRKIGVAPPTMTFVESAAEGADGLRGVFSARRIGVVCDVRTHSALAESLIVAFGSRFVVDCLVLPGVPQADMATVEHLRAAAGGYDGLAAVGGGTINDLCKYAASLDNKPYAAFPTAPSMNGYASANASILSDGHKQSFPARLPVAIICVVDTLAAAPVRLIRAGLGDSLARTTAQADWLLSHLMHDTPYDPRPFAWLAPLEPALLDSAASLAAGDREAVMRLLRVLLLSGLGMTLAGGSYPASQGEHAIAHVYEALAGAGETLHGEQIGVTTLYMSRLQAALLAALPEAIAAHIRPLLLPPERIETALRQAGAPVTPQELGWDDALYKEAVRRAPGLRDRFGFLNIR